MAEVVTLEERVADTRQATDDLFKKVRACPGGWGQGRDVQNALKA